MSEEPPHRLMAAGFEFDAAERRALYRRPNTSLLDAIPAKPDTQSPTGPRLPPGAPPLRRPATEELPDMQVAAPRTIAALPREGEPEPPVTLRRSGISSSWISGAFSCG